ncbi:MAG: amino acid permease C-terminal domain-containing protein, partial [Candidatus Acidiferrum sp.]
VMRVRRPDVKRPFRTPWVPLVPILGMAISLALIVSASFQAKMSFVVWLVVGLVIYFTYSRKHSRLRMSQQASAGD